MKVLVDIKFYSPGGKGFIDELKAEFPDVTFLNAGTVEEQIRDIRDADVYHGWPPREAFLAAKKLRWVHIPATGIDQIKNVPEMIDSDVVLTNCRGPHASSMADHVIGMMVSLAHHLQEQWEDQRAHRWEPMKYCNRFVELGGKTMGILALGDLGMSIARRAHGFGMKVYGVDKHPDRVLERNGGSVSSVVMELWGRERLDDLLRISDWFVVAAPLTPETRGLINRRRLGLLREGAYVIVISRGNIVDEEALAEALQSGRLAGAGLDALAQEPLPEDSPLWDMENVILSPHASGVPPEMFEGRKQIFKENLWRFLANEPFLYVPDKKTGY